MKKRIRLLLAALAAASSIASAQGPLVHDFYVRGGFNGWGIDHKLVHAGGGIYQVEVELPPGNHPFKIGRADWSDEWVIDPARTVRVTPGSAYPMSTSAGPEDYLFVKTSARYRFTIDASRAGAPVLSVTRIEAARVTEAAPHPASGPQAVLAFPTWDGKRETAAFSADDAPLRTYVHSTTAQLRDPGPQFARYTEPAGVPRVRSGSLPFDALFALAATEMKQDSVSRIVDGNYNGGAPVDCECFETGEKWHYVWTRDLSYAAALGLAMLDPQRVRNSLDFKLSGYRAGIAKVDVVPGGEDGFQVIQDTGSGGSWPVSTDRVTWAFGAEAALRSLPPAERAAFAPRALKALSNTIEIDRVAAFDPRTGLYTGEQSFLDWREQSYASWIVDDLSSMATSVSLSTNAAHYKALTLAARLAREQGDRPRAQRYAAWAASLRSAINDRLWLKDAGMYSSLAAGHLDGAPMHKFDWLGQALAIVTGIASDTQAASILARYPHGPMGPPVIHPQQPGRPVYHNRAIWPFVTAYGLKAAAQHRNVSVADAAYASLMRGAALNISNMENLEWLSGQSLLLDEANPDLIGPVINSRRQLWSVGAYLGMVIENVFGVTVSDTGLRVRPFITARLRRETFGQTGVLKLQGLSLRGKDIAVTVHLPAAARGNGYHTVERIRLNGRDVGEDIRWEQLAAQDNRIDITLGWTAPGAQAITPVNANPYSESADVFAPPEPAITAARREKTGVTRIDTGPVAPGAVLNIYRDGRQVAAGGRGRSWLDRSGGAAACYAIEAQYTASGHRSHHSAPACVGASVEIPVTDRRVESTVSVDTATGRIKGWGEPRDRFAVRSVGVPEAGTYAVQLRYHNAANQINLGISGGVKWLAVKDAHGRVVAQGVVQLPHTRLARGAEPGAYSTPLIVKLAPGKPYRIEMSDFYNMSYLQSNSTFSAAGGVAGPSNRFDIHGVRLRAITDMGQR
ncbi:esterase [Pseudoduganella sp. GCM10020061]|uniref:MGH1-like glycoside hydrolase domain-containing protein n=1 Tax=Pseudoduganella sp. GCM10020061 TaxID=3317345 RepID=UPI00363AADB0